MPTLIKPKDVLKILPFVSYAGLYAGSYETNRLTRVPAGKQTLYIKEECEALVRELVERGEKLKQAKQDRIEWDNRKVPTELY